MPAVQRPQVFADTFDREKGAATPCIDQQLDFLGSFRQPTGRMFWLRTSAELVICPILMGCPCRSVSIGRPSTAAWIFDGTWQI